MTLIGLLIALIVVCALFWATTRILAAFSIGDPMATVVRVLLVVIVIVWLLSQFGGLPGLRIS